MRATTFDTTREQVRRVGAFAVSLLLAAVAFVVTAPVAHSQTIASVTVGACSADGSQATVTVTIFDDTYAVDVIDSDGVAQYFGFPGGSDDFPVGSYTWIAFEVTDPNKTPVEQGAFTIACTDETTTTTVAETTTTTVAETTTSVELTTTTTTPTESTVITSTSTTTPEEPTTSQVAQVTTSTTVPPVTASTLPFTGAELTTTALLGGLALAGGMTLLLTGRRRPQPDEGDSLGDW